MLVLTIFSLCKVNRERMNSLFMQMQSASSLTHGILQFYSGINCQKGEVTYLFRFSL